ncbi:MAG: S41 family peptidase, partial [Acidobacteriota bacterium]|nr:S41 family peptidase [Acidobacteriota bacterium]
MSVILQKTKWIAAMYFEDARDLTVSALQLLQSQKDDLGCPNLKVWSPFEFRGYAKTQELTRHEKLIIVDQAILLIDQFYAHLPFKRARYASDPVQSFRLVRAQLDELSDLEFHEKMIQSMVGLRDAHTFYALPNPYRGAFAFLPFRLECFHERAGKRKFIVTSVLEGFDHPRFTVKAEVISWNGVAIEQAIEREGHLDPGGNPSTRFARSLHRICNRSLALSIPPLESFVVLQYVPAAGGAQQYGIVLPWHIATDGIISKERQDTNTSISEAIAEGVAARKMLFHRGELMRDRALRHAQQTSGPTPAVGQPPDLSRQSKFPHVFEFQYSGGTAQPDGIDPEALHDPAHPDQKFGYIRIRTFDLDPSDRAASNKFVAEFERIAALMQSVAPDGLILDIRSNPGGAIDAAERILQFLTPIEIRPADFHFISSRMTQQIATVLYHNNSKGAGQSNQREWLPWILDLKSSIGSGSALTPGRPLTSPEQANDTGQIYQGPVTLIIDALTYSASDIFAGGFQDHGIGVIVGVDENTGGGGANRWLHEELRQNLKLHGLHEMPLEKLPGDSQMGLAIRRSSRVGMNAGQVIEDVGVKAELRHHITRNDL